MQYSFHPYIQDAVIIFDVYSLPHEYHNIKSSKLHIIKNTMPAPSPFPSLEAFYSAYKKLRHTCLPLVD